MYFEYYKHLTEQGEIIYRPQVRVFFKNGPNFILTDANIDTGADYTILPIELATPLKIKLEARTIFFGAGNNEFNVYKSPRPIDHILKLPEMKQIKISSHVYFAESQPAILLGNNGFLDKLKITFDGPKHRLKIDGDF